MKRDSAKKVIFLVGAPWLFALGILIWVSVAYSQRARIEYVAVNATVDSATVEYRSAVFNVTFRTLENVTSKARVYKKFSYTADAKEYTEAHLAGSTILVYYDSSKPEKAVIVVSNANYLAGLIFCAVLVGLPFLVIPIVIGSLAIHRHFRDRKLAAIMEQMKQPSPSTTNANATPTP